MTEERILCTNNVQKLGDDGERRWWGGTPEADTSMLAGDGESGCEGERVAFLAVGAGRRGLGMLTPTAGRPRYGDLP